MLGWLFYLCYTEQEEKIKAENLAVLKPIVSPTLFHLQIIYGEPATDCSKLDDATVGKAQLLNCEIYSKKYLQLNLHFSEEL